MAAVIAARATSSTAAAGTSHTLSLPAGTESGDLLIAVIAAFATGGTDPPSISALDSWTLLDESDPTEETRGKGAVFWKVSDGADDVAFTTSISAQSSHSVLRITGQASTGTVLDYTYAQRTTPDCDPPDHSPGGGSAEYLWIAATVAGRGTDSSLAITAAPTNYGNLNTIATERSTAATAERTTTAASENPGAFSQTDVQEDFAWTIAVYADAGGGAALSVAPIMQNYRNMGLMQ